MTYSFQNLVDPTSKDIGVNISEQMRKAAEDLVLKYSNIYEGYSKAPNAGIRAHMSLVDLEKSSEYGNLLNATYTANEHLDPRNHESKTQIQDMRLAQGGILNELIKAEGEKAGIANIPVPFATSRLRS